MAKIVGTSKADTLRGTSAADQIFGLANDDSIYGGGGNDGLHGDDGADYLQGDKGNDIIYGGSGNDGIVGGPGNDSINGGLDGDLIYGGSGNDRFYYNSTQGAPVGDYEQISDFAKGDIIDLSAIDAQESRAGNQNFTFIGNRDFTAAGQVHAYYDNVNHWTVVEGSTDSDFAPEFQIILNSGYAVSAADFFL